MAVLGLHFCARAFSSCGKWGPLFIAVCRPLIIAACLVAEHRLQTRRLSNCAHGPSRSAACGILPDQGPNPCPLHWQADSQPPHHRGSPAGRFLTTASPGKPPIKALEVLSMLVVFDELQIFFTPNCCFSFTFVSASFCYADTFYVYVVQSISASFLVSGVCIHGRGFK